MSVPVPAALLRATRAVPESESENLKKNDLKKEKKPSQIFYLHYREKLAKISTYSIIVNLDTFPIRLNVLLATFYPENLATLKTYQNA